VSPVVFGWLIDLTGNWNVPFATGVGILIAGAAAVTWLRPDLPLLVNADVPAGGTGTH
jgi:cyanate permease